MDRLKDEELEKHYAEMFDMFASPGWARLMQQTDDAIGGLTLKSASRDTVDFMRGQLDNLEWLKNLRQMHEFAYKKLLEAQQDDVQPTSTAEALFDGFEGRARVVR